MLSIVSDIYSTFLSVMPQLNLYSALSRIAKRQTLTISSTSKTNENIEAVKEMILDNRRITIKVVNNVAISFGSCQAIFTYGLVMKRGAAKKAKPLHFEQEQCRMDIVQEMLTVLTGDESWVYSYDIETKAFFNLIQFLWSIFFSNYKNRRPTKTRLTFLFVKKKTDNPKWLILSTYIIDLCTNITGKMRKSNKRNSRNFKIGFIFWSLLVFPMLVCEFNSKDQNYGWQWIAMFRLLSSFKLELSTSSKDVDFWFEYISKLSHELWNPKSSFYYYFWIRFIRGQQNDASLKTVFYLLITMQLQIKSNYIRAK